MGKNDIGLNFNPRSRMGSDQNRRCFRNYTRHFNPRSRMGSDLLHLLSFCFSLEISIHAPAWGATHALSGEHTSPTDFNPRSRMGSDPIIGFPTSQILISIHAPAWGATLSQPGCHLHQINFNPRSRMGSDPRQE